MIKEYKKQDFIGLLDFITSNRNSDFYITEENRRKYVNTSYDLTKLIKSSNIIYLNKENGKILGVLLVWVSLGNNLKRKYIKVNAINKEVVKGLLTVLLWNKKSSYYVKIKKDSDYIKAFKEKGFIFKGNRGSEILLIKKMKSGEVKND